MARDLRNIGANKNNYPDKCYYYDKTYIQNNEVNRDAQPLGRFYKRDKQAFQWTKVSVGSGAFSNDYHFIGVVETCDKVDDIRVGMYVVDNTGMIFKVESPIIADDLNQSKVIGTRPQFVTTLTLKGVELK